MKNISFKTTKLWILTYLLFVAIYTLIFWLGNPSQKVMLDSNELGDFLAGIFAPLAFLFLVLGYKQQGEALAKSNLAIVEQLKFQREQLEILKAEQKEREHSAQPLFEIVVSCKPSRNLESAFLYEDYNFLPKDEYLIIKISIKNNGEKVSSFYLSSILPFHKGHLRETIFEPNDKKEFEIILLKQDIDNYLVDDQINFKLLLEYRISTGQKYNIDYGFEIIGLSNRKLGINYDGMGDYKKIY